MIKIFGIKNCDTVKKALKWLEQEHIDYQFHDFRKDGLSEALIDHFLTHFDYSALINTRGMTWRKLADDQKTNIDEMKARHLMLAYDALIKRPIWLFENGEMTIGFTKKTQESIAEKLKISPFES